MQKKTNKTYIKSLFDEKMGKIKAFSDGGL